MTQRPELTDQELAGLMMEWEIGQVATLPQPTIQLHNPGTGEDLNFELTIAGWRVVETGQFVVASDQIATLDDIVDEATEQGRWGR
jgi:hypothetical protein